MHLLKCDMCGAEVESERTEDICTREFPWGDDVYQCMGVLELVKPDVSS